MSFIIVIITHYYITSALLDPHYPTAKWSEVNLSQAVSDGAQNSAWSQSQHGPFSDGLATDSSRKEDKARRAI